MKKINLLKALNESISRIPFLRRKGDAEYLALVKLKSIVDQVSSDELSNKVLLEIIRLLVTDLAIYMVSPIHRLFEQCYGSREAIQNLKEAVHHDNFDERCLSAINTSSAPQTLSFLVREYCKNGWQITQELLESLEKIGRAHV